MLTVNDKKTIEKMIGEKLYDVVKAAVNAMEDRITKRLSRELNQVALPLFHTPPKYEATPPQINITKAITMQATTFGQLPGGSVFRLEQGSQPIIKLEHNTHWTAPMAHEANAFYLRTGSSMRIADNKRIVPLKSTITIDQ